MPSTTPNGQQLLTPEVLTLAETAAFLRVPEELVVSAAKDGTLPGQLLGGEWRFLKQSVTDWLRFGSNGSRKFSSVPPQGMSELTFWEELFQSIERRAGKTTSEPPSPKPGTKEAVRKHFGVLKDADDLEEQLALLRSYRKAAE